MFISQTCSKCWDEMFGDKEDDIPEFKVDDKWKVNPEEHKSDCICDACVIKLVNQVL
jgi:hypothetical protein